MTIIVLVTMRWRPVDDCLLATISEATSGPENLVLLAISGPDLAWMLWLVLLFSLMHNFTEIGVTSAASKTVRSTEHARLFGLLAALRVVTFQLQRVSYASLTSGAEDTFPAAQFLVAAVCACFNASLAASLYRRRPRRRVEGEGGGGGEGEGEGERGEGDRQCEKIGGVDVAIYF
ncbi:uncharacterized protein LOC122264820 [Penaeus japonicus]|uniref:uncharacterized protein LOC122264820 n=1 Tax=Penaeus japonicus TaxID=27405 RepID=UPI001C712A66|nr:uncharacterized protein LOC122264820 [Penaeus japonicus]